MSSPAPNSAAQEKVPSEDIIARKTDLCISNAVIKTGIGLGSGVVLSVLLFRRRAFPVWLGTGFGLGSAYTDCERSFNPYSSPGLRVLPPTTSSASSSSKTTSPSSSSSGDSTILERLSQRAGEAVDSAKGKAKPAVEEIKDQYGAAKGKVEAKGKEVKSEVEKKIRQV